MTADRYWRLTPDPLLSAASLVEFVVLDCEPANGYSSSSSVALSGASGGGSKRGKGGGGDAAAPALPLWEAVVSE